jgi:hypothetical protein
MTYDEIRTIAKQYPGVEDSTSYGTPALKVAGKGLVRLREDGETVVLHCEMEERAVLMEADPETFFITEHYRNWPTVLVRLDRVDPGVFQDAFERSWRARAPKKLVAVYDSLP